MIKLTPKQIEYTQQSKARWNFKSGAVRSGKSFVDISNVIPERIIERIGLPGLAVIIGVSRDTIERNVLQPMREIYGDKRVGIINSRNTVHLFGETVYCLGAEKISQVAKIQGASIKYCYGNSIKSVCQCQNSKQNNYQTYRMFLAQSVPHLLFRCRRNLPRLQ